MSEVRGSIWDLYGLVGVMLLFLWDISGFLFILFSEKDLSESTALVVE